jgi:hypothetical protein
MSAPIAPSRDSAATSNNVRTRSGRVSKPPERYEPVEQVEDDYASEDYDTDEVSEVSSEVSYDESEDEGEDDADENGNLDGFVVSDKSESDDSDTDGEPVRRAPIKKRPITRKRKA